MARKYQAGPDVGPEEVVRDSKGNVIDDAYIERAVEDVHRQVGRGRPSLTEPGAVSPEVKARVPAELKERVNRESRRQGKSVSEFIRDALERYLTDVG
jgi:predicted HicB family RNase H-like nuclease